MPVTPLNPTILQFQSFYNDPFVHSIALKHRWTISDSNKCPIDMVAIRDEQKVYGAKYPDERCLVTLPDSLSIIPESANHAYYLTAAEDGFVVLDAEPSCSDELKQTFLQMPYIYGEISMSGKGLHLVFPLPASGINYPVAMGKTALQNKALGYEILINHYVTFTRRMLPPASGDIPFEPVFEELAALQTAVVSADVDIAAQEPEIPHKDELVGLLSRVSQKRTLASYDGDHSRYEFGTAARLYNKLNNLLNTSRYRDIDYDDTQRTWLIYEALRRQVPKRPKHDTDRNGLPWLLFVSHQAVSKLIAQDAEK